MQLPDCNIKYTNRIQDSAHQDPVLHTPLEGQDVKVMAATTMG